MSEFEMTESLLISGCKKQELLLLITTQEQNCSLGREKGVLSFLNYCAVY